MLEQGVSTVGVERRSTPRKAERAGVGVVEQDKPGNAGSQPRFHQTDVGALPEGISATSGNSADGLHYFYQDGEILMATEDYDRLIQAGDQRIVVEEDREVPALEGRLVYRPAPGELGPLNAARDNALLKLGITRLQTTAGNNDVPGTVAEFRTPRDLTGSNAPATQFIPRTWPNHFMALQGHVPWHPGGPRTPAPPLPPPPRRGVWPLPGEGVTVGVVDTGVAGRSHLPADFFGDQLEGDEDPLGEPDGDLTVSDGHGTFIAGIIATHAPGAKVVVRAVRALPAAHDEYVRDDDLAGAILAMAESGVDIINLSVGGQAHGHTGMPATIAAIEHLRVTHPHIAIVAAAGNSGADTQEFPAALTTVIGVGAIKTENDEPAAFTNFGEWVDASAPGVEIHSTFVRWTNPRFEGFARWSGTSFSTPMVAAAIATRMSPGSWRQYLWFLRPRSAREAADRLLHDPALPRRRGLGVIVRPRSYAS